MVRADVTSGNWEAFTGGKGLNQVFAQAPVGMAVLDGRELRYTFANPKYQQIIGSRDPVGKRMVEMFPDLAGSAIEAILEEELLRGSAIAVVVVHPRYQGAEAMGTVDREYLTTCLPEDQRRYKVTVKKALNKRNNFVGRPIARLALEVRLPNKRCRRSLRAQGSESEASGSATTMKPRRVPRSLRVESMRRDLLDEP